MTPTHLGPAEQLFSAEAVHAAIQRMAVAINADLEPLVPHRPVVVLTVLSGAIVIVGQLLPLLHFPLHLDCVQVSRYGDKTRGGDLLWRLTPRENLLDATVLIVDDILDEGVTLLALQDYCLSQGAAAVHTAVMVRKERERAREVPVDYVGLEVPDRFVFGFGLDARGLGRNAPGIFALIEEDAHG
ncbi:hypoxanthine-guanine phosphoribosyltransferase [Acidithiobacillus acidisediminis]|uniref:hypoxanthine-guanine phosphoribosyltransferase n=1 Tax=Acidithiobacillus TaxID=119977 RepID=UPI00200EF8E1|nr:hypoxanthine-guanine phosphoribosyltransferase [Acidithiobacillus sp. S30A2]